jgi:hypothetical protein
MGLLARISSIDSIQEMEQAKQDRFLDGLACAKQERFFVACYLLGYVIEMALKLAYFRLRPVGVAQNLDRELAAARQMSRARGVRSLHDMAFWAESLIEERKRTGRPLDAVLALELATRAGQVAQDWTEVLHYRRSVPADDAYVRLRAQVKWFLSARQQRLWS